MKRTSQQIYGIAAAISLVIALTMTLLMLAGAVCAEEVFAEPTEGDETPELISSLDITLADPVCGTVVELDEGVPTIGPYVSVTSDTVSTVRALWGGDGAPFSGTIVGGQKYGTTVMVFLAFDQWENYSYDVDNMTVTLNGKPVEPDEVTQVGVVIQTECVAVHDWDEPEYQWKDFDAAVTASRTCKTEGCDGKETETVDTVSEVITAPTETEKGKEKITATFENKAFAVQTKEIDLPRVIRSLDVTLANPVCGTEVELDSENLPTVRPESSVTSDKVSTTMALWGGGGAPFTGKIVGGEKYNTAVMVFITESQWEEYSYDEKNLTVTLNGETVEPFTISKYGVLIQTESTAEHDWNEGEVTKAATMKETGEKLYTCSGCGETRTEILPELTASEAIAPGAPAEAADQAITALKSEKDPAGSKYLPLKPKSTKQTKTSVTVSWTKQKKAAKYVIYGNKCGSKNKMKKLATATTGSKTFKKVAGKTVKKGTTYKFIIVALDKEDKVVSTSKIIHAYTTGGKYTNHKAVKAQLKSGKKWKTIKAVTVKTGKTKTIRGKGVKQAKKLKYKKCVGMRYESSKPAVATVSSKGVIKGVKKGTAYVYVYSQNGKYAKVKVTVK